MFDDLLNDNANTLESGSSLRTGYLASRFFSRICKLLMDLLGT